MLKPFGSRRNEAGGSSRAYRTFFGLSLFAIAAAVVIAFPSPGAAQVDGLAMWRAGGCSSCHGGFGTGGGGNENPEGPNLRRSTLDRDAVRETIACGRGAMPYHLQGAYVEVPCYGMPVGEPPEDLNAGSRRLTEEELDALVDFLFEYVVGVPLTRQVCGAYFGGDANHPACAQYPE